MNYTLSVNNIKCGGCANSITSKINGLSGVKEAAVDAENGTVSFEFEDETTLELVRSTLSKMGYPEDDPTMLQSAKSYVSCMVGRVKG